MSACERETETETETETDTASVREYLEMGKGQEMKFAIQDPSSKTVTQGGGEGGGFGHPTAMTQTLKVRI